MLMLILLLQLPVAKAAWGEKALQRRKPGQNPAKIRPESGHQEIITVRKPLYVNENPAKTQPEKGGGGWPDFRIEPSEFTPRRFPAHNRNRNLNRSDSVSLWPLWQRFESNLLPLLILIVILVLILRLSFVPSASFCKNSVLALPFFVLFVRIRGFPHCCPN
jgi:hypothetical protein